jgi:hypothetical protein
MLDHLCPFSPRKYTESWTLRGCQSAINTNSKERARLAEYDGNMVKMKSSLHFSLISDFSLFCFMKICAVLLGISTSVNLNPHSNILMLVYIKILISHVQFLKKLPHPLL